MLRPRPGAEICFQKWGYEMLVRKSNQSQCAVLSSFTVWGPGPRLRAPVGSRGKKPLETPGFNSIFNAKYCLNLFSFNTFLSCSPIGKKLHGFTPLIRKWGSKGQSPLKFKGLQHFQCKILSKFVLFFFITHSSYKCLPIEKNKNKNKKTKQRKL